MGEEQIIQWSESRGQMVDQRGRTYYEAAAQVSERDKAPWGFTQPWLEANSRRAREIMKDIRASLATS